MKIAHTAFFQILTLWTFEFTFPSHWTLHNQFSQNTALTYKYIRIQHRADTASPFTKAPCVIPWPQIPLLPLWLSSCEASDLYFVQYLRLLELGPMLTLVKVCDYTKQNMHRCTSESCPILEVPGPKRRPQLKIPRMSHLARAMTHFRCWRCVCNNGCMIIRKGKLKKLSKQVCIMLTFWTYSFREVLC
jgi:hypothetical protein